MPTETQFVRRPTWNNRSGWKANLPVRSQRNDGVLHWHKILSCCIWITHSSSGKSRLNCHRYPFSCSSLVERPPRWSTCGSRQWWEQRIWKQIRSMHIRLNRHRAITFRWDHASNLLCFVLLDLVSAAVDRSSRACWNESISSAWAMNGRGFNYVERDLVTRENRWGKIWL